jgi:NADPH:quinone reductase-like Zn-dependent oxidoreductase
MICHIGQNLPAILRGEKAPIELMMADGLLDQYKQQCHPRALSQAAALLRQFVHRNPRAHILELEAPAMTATLTLLQALGTAESGGPLAASYHVTKKSWDEESQATALQELAAWSDIVAFDTLDIKQDPSTQGFESQDYDLVIANRHLFSTSSSSDHLSLVRKLIKPGGKLLLVETTRDDLDRQFIFGLLPEWWKEDHKLGGQHSSLNAVASWDQSLKASGFTGVDIHIPDCEADEMYTTSTMLATVPPISPTQPPSSHDIVLVTSNKMGPAIDSTWLVNLQQAVSKDGSDVGSLPSVYAIESLAPVSVTGKICVFVGEIDKPLLRDLDAETMDGIRTMAINCKGLLWLTRGATVDSQDPKLALAQGFLRSLRNEYPTRLFVSLDLDPGSPLWSLDNVLMIQKVLQAGFGSNSDTHRGEFEYAVRGGVILIPRILKNQAQSKAISPRDVADQTNANLVTQPLYQPDRPLSMHVGMPGLIDTIAFDDDPSMSAVSATSDLSPNLVEVEPRAYGVNFRDVMVAMGQLHERVMGLECSGVIKRVGIEAASRGYTVGNKVFCLLRGPFGSRVHIEWANVAHMPEGLSFEDAASLPVIFCTAYICLVDMAHLQRGQTVLIHAAAGGVGQAAIMIAKYLGLEIYATVGTAEKRSLVSTKYGIPDDHIFSSRDASFAAGIMAATNGRGVDAVVNSLAGPLLQESFIVLAPFGHFLEIGKRDLEINSHLEMRAFTRQVSFSAFYLLPLFLTIFVR